MTFRRLALAALAAGSMCAPLPAGTPPNASADDGLDFTFAHAGVSVPDLEASKAWYHRVLGFDLERETSLPFVPARIAIMKRGPLRFELFQVEGSNPLPPDRRFPNRDIVTNGNKHVAFEVADIARTTSILRARGADIAFEYAGRVVFIRDNAGNLIEFIHSETR